MNKYQIGVGPRWVAALTAAETEDPGKPKEDPRRHAQLEAELATAKARIDTLEQQNRELTGRLERIAALAAAGPVSAPDAAALPEQPSQNSREGRSDAARCDNQWRASCRRQSAFGRTQAADSTCAARSGALYLGPGGDTCGPQTDPVAKAAGTRLPE
ncbi:MAG TPA: hypothetical protein VNZ53_29595 [Steroidobacteraceae bacterium]|nr:hypothetical protein [Steroidobacteraceae bacterium]